MLDGKIGGVLMNNNKEIQGDAVQTRVCMCAGWLMWMKCLFLLIFCHDVENSSAIH